MMASKKFSTTEWRNLYLQINNNTVLNVLEVEKEHRSGVYAFMHDVVGITNYTHTDSTCLFEIEKTDSGYTALIEWNTSKIKCETIESFLKIMKEGEKISGSSPAWREVIANNGSRLINQGKRLEFTFLKKEGTKYHVRLLSEISSQTPDFYGTRIEEVPHGLKPETEAAAYLHKAWHHLATDLNKALALENARIAYDLLLKEKDESPESVLRKAMGFQIVATIYVWNNLFKEAFEIEPRFLFMVPVWSQQEVVELHLLMLIIKNQKDHLDEIFENEYFVERFKAYYVAFVSLLKNPNYEFPPDVNMGQIVNIINRVTAGRKKYLSITQ